MSIGFSFVCFNKMKSCQTCLEHLLGEFLHHPAWLYSLNVPVMQRLKKTVQPSRCVKTQADTAEKPQSSEEGGTQIKKARLAWT